MPCRPPKRLPTPTPAIAALGGGLRSRPSGHEVRLFVCELLVHRGKVLNCTSKLTPVVCLWVEHDTPGGVVPPGPPLLHGAGRLRRHKVPELAGRCGPSYAATSAVCAVAFCLSGQASAMEAVQSPASKQRSCSARAMSGDKAFEHFPETSDRSCTNNLPTKKAPSSLLRSFRKHRLRDDSYYPNLARRLSKQVCPSARAPQNDALLRAALRAGHDECARDTGTGYGTGRPGAKTATAPTSREGRQGVRLEAMFEVCRGCRPGAARSPNGGRPKYRSEMRACTSDWGVSWQPPAAALVQH